MKKFLAFYSYFGLLVELFCYFGLLLTVVYMDAAGYEQRNRMGVILFILVVSLLLRYYQKKSKRV